MESSTYWQATESLERRQSERQDESESDPEAHLTEVAAGVPTDKERFRRESGLERRESQARSRRSSRYRDETELTEITAGAPDPRRSDDEEAIADESTDSSRSQTNGIPRDDQAAEQKGDGIEQEHATRSKFATELYIHSYLILYSIFGVLARLGIEKITSYPGTPVISPVLWANFAGSLFFGFLLEDQRLFREEWGVKTQSSHLRITSRSSAPTREAVKKKHSSVKKTIPLYIGLSTGFCGSLTSFSSFIRDAFFALSNTLPSPLLTDSSPTTIHHNGGYSFEALLAVLILHIAISLSAFHIGAHLALLFDPLLPSLPFRLVRHYLDPVGVILAIGCWIGAIIFAIFPATSIPATSSINENRYVLFSIVFAPLGCLLRFHLSKYMNAIIPAFPLGTFAANIFGTLVLGMCYDIQHAPTSNFRPSHSLVACQVLQGVQEGFCGALTTVSTWVGELNGLRRSHGYTYGAVSVATALASLIAIMGSLLWTKGFEKAACVT